MIMLTLAIIVQSASDADLKVDPVTRHEALLAIRKTKAQPDRRGKEQRTRAWEVVSQLEFVATMYHYSGTCTSGGGV